MIVAVLGANGALGKKVCEFYFSRGVKVIKAGRNIDNVDFVVDITSLASVDKFVMDNSFDVLINCAGSYSNNFGIDAKVNVEGSYNVLSSMYTNKPKSRVVLIGSSAEYGIPNNIKVDEMHPLMPINAYGLSKKMQYDNFKYFSRKGFDVILLRIFNLVDRTLPDSLLVGRVYNQIFELQDGKRNKLTLGYLGNKRDYISSQKAAELISLAVDKGVSGQAYNIGSGKAILIKDLVEELMRQEGLKYNDFDEVVSYEQVTSRAELEIIEANCSKINNLQ
jgi:GDP-4-dehydro-6-deoxy-D-mannose reductase